MERIFRGKTPSQDEHFDDGEWVEGYYTCFNGKEHRIYSGYAETDCGDYYPDWFNVRPETVGQFVGLTDKNVKKVFEGDIVKVYDNFDYIGETLYVGTVQWDDTFLNWELKTSEKTVWQLKNLPSVLYYEVIGNVFDTPELLEVK